MIRALRAVALGLLILTAWSLAPRSHEGVALPRCEPGAAQKRVVTGNPERRNAALFGVTWERRRDRDHLVWLDPRTLSTKRRLLLGRQGGYKYDLNPDGSRLSIGSAARRTLIIDSRTLQITQRLDLGPGYIERLSWTDPDRLTVVSTVPRTSGRIRVQVIRPSDAAVLHKSTLEGDVLAVREVGNRIVLLLSDRGPGDAPAEARLVVIEAEGAAHPIELPEVRAGYYSQGKGQPGRQLVPGLTVAPRSETAFVAAIDGTIHEIDLLSMSVTRHELMGADPSLVGAIAGAFTPPVAAKLSDVAERRARYLGEGLLAVTGSELEFELRGAGLKEASRSFGVHIVDTTTWRACVLDTAANALTRSGDLLLASDRYRPGAGPGRGEGIAAFTLDGDQAWRALDGQFVDRVIPAGEAVYVRHGWSRVLTSRIELATGRVTTTHAGPLKILGL